MAVRTVLFLDEDPPVRKAQQDALLPAVENWLVPRCCDDREPLLGHRATVSGRCSSPRRRFPDADLTDVVEAALTEERPCVAFRPRREARDQLVRIAGRRRPPGPHRRSEAAAGVAEDAAHALTGKPELRRRRGAGCGASYRISAADPRPSINRALRDNRYDRAGDQHYGRRLGADQVDAWLGRRRRAALPGPMLEAGRTRGSSPSASSSPPPRTWVWPTPPRPDRGGRRAHAVGPDRDAEA